MPSLHIISLYLMAGLYILAGISHFVQPKFFIKITPPWVPAPEKVNILVGFIEIILGLGLLFNQTQHYAAWGVIALLIAVFPANWYHHQLETKKGKSIWPTLIRLPVQIILIMWAYQFTK